MLSPNTPVSRTTEIKWHSTDLDVYPKPFSRYCHDERHDVPVESMGYGSALEPYMSKRVLCLFDTGGYAMGQYDWTRDCWTCEDWHEGFHCDSWVSEWAYLPPDEVQESL